MAQLVLGKRTYEVMRSAGLLNEEVIQSAESEMGHTLPNGLRRFMLAHNGGLPFPSDVPHHCAVHVRLKWHPGVEASRYGGNTNLERIYRIGGDPTVDMVRANEDFRGRIPDDTIAFGYDAGGGQFLIGVGPANHGRIFFWPRLFEHELSVGEQPDYRNLADVSDRFEDFLMGMAPEPAPDESDSGWESRWFANQPIA